MLSSRVALIPESEKVAGLADGRYRAYVALLPEDAAKLGRAERKRCLDPGFYAEGSETPDGKVSRKRIVYCDRDPGMDQDSPVVTIRWAGDRYRVEAPDGPAAMRFRAVPGGLYLLQTDEDSKPDRYDYWFARVRASALDMFLLACADFRSAEKKDENGVSRCEVDSLATVQPELDAYAAGVREARKAPIAILTPIR
ncbi:MAG: hypothetical protein EOP60_07115 [Sphingomonadales bacterium]|nr:MAG: hypothetical protein EOP60_07115 [Sphingomonadales bacterium]